MSNNRLNLHMLFVKRCIQVVLINILLLDFRLRGIFCYSFVAHMRNILGFVFNLSIICVWDLYWLIIGMLDSLVISDRLDNLYFFANSGYMGFSVLTFIRNLFMCYHSLIISIEFFNWNIFHPSLGLRSSEDLLWSSVIA